MTVDQASMFMTGSLLIMIGAIIVVGGIVIINNIIHKYWKPVSFFTPDSWKAFNPPVEMIHGKEETSQKV
jgi:hypothetical protein